MSMIIEPLSDYSLGENLSSFEAYLFITREGFIRLHHHIPDYKFNILIRNEILQYEFSSIDDRKKALYLFIDRMKDITGREPRGEDVSTFILYLKAESTFEYDIAGFFNVYNQIADIVSKFCTEQERLIAMLPHFTQRNSVPHIHFLCQRKDGDSNVLQKYIIDKIRKRV